jgi:hypothetical protein
MQDILFPVATTGTNSKIGPTNVFAPLITVQPGTLAEFAVGAYTYSAAVVGDSINWGDGTSSTGSVTATTPGSFTVFAGHLYTSLGVYALNVHVAFANTGSLDITGTVTVEIVASVPTTGVQGFGDGGYVISLSPDVAFAFVAATFSIGINGGKGGQNQQNGGDFDHGSPAANHQAVLFTPGAMTPSAPPATPLVSPGKPAILPTARPVTTNLTESAGRVDNPSQDLEWAKEELQPNWQVLSAITPIPTKAASEAVRSGSSGDRSDAETAPAVAFTPESSFVDLLQNGIPDEQPDPAQATSDLAWVLGELQPAAVPISPSESEELKAANTLSDWRGWTTSLVLSALLFRFWPRLHDGRRSRLQVD